MELLLVLGSIVTAGVATSAALRLDGVVGSGVRTTAETRYQRRT